LDILAQDQHIPGAVNGPNFGKNSIGSYKGFINEKKKKNFFWPSSKIVPPPLLAQSKKLILQYLNILTYLTKKYYKFQNRSQKKSQSSEPLS
jgi:hypothetical protein